MASDRGASVCKFSYDSSSRLSASSRRPCQEHYGENLSWTAMHRLDVRAVPCRAVSCVVSCWVRPLRQQSVGTSGPPMSIGFAVLTCVHVYHFAREFNIGSETDITYASFCMTSFLILLYYVILQCDREKGKGTGGRWTRMIHTSAS